MTARETWARAAAKAKRTALEDRLAQQILAAKLSPPEREYRFDSARRWRFDFAWICDRLAVEVEGGIWTAGRHTRGKGFEADLEKYNAAALAGWCVLRFTGRHIRTGYALRTIEAELRYRRMPD